MSTHIQTTQDKGWDDLGSLSQVFEQFSIMHKARRLPHVMLLDGSETLNKDVLAIAMAGLYYCESQSGCGHCQGCRLVQKGRHPELLWVEEEGATIKLEQAKAIQEHLTVNPSRSFAGVDPIRLAVVIDIDKFSPQAANRLLKILEEPPEHARVIMTTSRRHGVLETIRSRCVRWQLRQPTHLKSDPALLVSSEEKQAFEKLFTIPGIADRVAVAEHIAKDLGLSAAEIAIKGEIVFNSLLKNLSSDRGNIRWQRIKSIRSTLTSLRQVAVRKKISLNPTLSAEGLGGMD